MKKLTAKKYKFKYKEGNCLIEGCPKTKIYIRGLCASHYNMIKRLVKDKKRTWEEFIEVGMANKKFYGKQTELFKKMMIKKFKKTLKRSAEKIKEEE